MIICLCRAVSDRVILGLIDQGARDFKNLRKECGVGGGCGKCVRVVKELISERTGLLSEESCGTKTPRYGEEKEYKHGQSFE